MNHAIELRGVRKEYADFVLGPVDLTLPGGTVLGLIGENGAGKTTLLKTMLGVVRPDGGEIRLLGREAAQAKVDIGAVFEDCFFYEGLRAKDVSAVLRRVYPTWDEELFRRCLQKYAIAGEKKIKALSRGMRMKLSLAAALAHRPRLLLLDEATAGLDPVAREEILDELLDFVADEAHALVLSSHITSDLERVADYIAYLHRGKLLLLEEKDRLLETYGKVICGAGDLEGVEPSLLIGARSSAFSATALVRDRAEFVRRYPKIHVERVSLEDIMVHLNRRETE